MTTGAVGSNVRVLVLFMVATWIALVASLYFGMHLATNLWIFVLGVWAAAWTGAAVMTLATAFVIRRWRGLALGVLAVGVVLGFVVANTDWKTVFALTWLPAHRGQFDDAVELVRSGQLDPQVDYYGATLPPRLRSIAVDGRMSVVGRCGGKDVLFVPEFVGIPDGALGYLKFDCSTIPIEGAVVSDEEYLDGYGDFLTPRIDLGNGWWWAD